MALSAKEIEQNLGNAKLAHKLIMANGGSITIDGKKFTSGTEAFNYVKTKDISKLVVETKTPTPQPGGQPAQIISKSGQGSMEEIYGYIAGAFDIGELTDEATTLLAIVFAESDGFEQVQSGHLATNQNISNRSGMAEPSFGLFQINADVHLGKIRKEAGGEINWSNSTQLNNSISNKNFYDLAIADQEAVAKWLSNPKNNSKIAKQVYDDQGYTAWSVYKNNDYMDYIKDATAATVKYYGKSGIPGGQPPPSGNPAIDNIISSLGKYIGQDLEDQLREWAELDIGPEWAALTKDLIENPKLASRARKFEQYQTLQNEIIDSYIDYIFAKDQERYSSNPEERGRQVGNLIGNAMAWIKKGGMKWSQFVNNIANNVAQAIDFEETSGFWSNLVDQLLLEGTDEDIDTMDKVFPELAEALASSPEVKEKIKIEFNQKDLTPAEISQIYYDSWKDTDAQSPLAPTTKTYWGRYDTGSWGTFPLDQKPADFKWAWELPEFEGQDQELFTGDKDLENDIYPLTVDFLPPPVVEEEVVDDEVVDDEVVDEEVTTADTFEDTLELGTGYVANEVLNDWNNIPQGGILIDAGGQKFLGYQVPGAGQIYSEPPMYMLYQILDNDVYEAGLLTEGTPANVNVVLTSVADLNQYGLVVGGTDEITDDVEHPFIRFVENFEAGKKINPWLGDTRINPNSGVTYQQEAIEFLAEQAIEQWTPEETTVRVEASDWYQESTPTQKQWLTKQLTQPVTAQQELDDKKIDIRTQMEASGMASPPDGLVDYFAEKNVTGMWSELYTTEQLALLADPYKPGARDTNLINFIEGVGFGSLDRASVMEKEVQDLYRTYLGPSLGNASATEISEKAGQLRNNPDAGGELKSYLEQQRLAMFPNYTNPTLRYNDIVQPYKNLVNQVWGEEADETSDWFIQMVQNNNIESAYDTLREKGIELGVERVQNQALQDLEDAIGEGSVQTDVGVNT
jgi:hypothetical protein